MRDFLISALIIIFCDIFCFSLEAATLTVCSSGCDYTTIAAAINAANDGDTIQIGAGTYPVTDLAIDKSLIIQGAGVQQTTVQGAYISSKLIVGHTNPHVTVHLNDLTIDIIGFNTWAESVTVQDCIITGHYWDGPPISMYNDLLVAPELNVIGTRVIGNWEGAILGSGGDVYITNCTFIDNYANFYGGAITLESCNAQITNCSFTSNKSLFGGAINSSNSNAIISNCTFSSNHSEAIECRESSAVHISYCTFSSNIGSYNGGAIHCVESSATIVGCSFNGNLVSSGGAISSIGCECDIVNSTFTGNSASYGGQYI